MAKKSLKVKLEKKKKKAMQEYKQGKKITFSTKLYNRCKLCGRPHGYMRRFEICRICFRELAREGKIMGVTKSSW
ncbi:type Z 30S ribosomal protein S14 [Candidatus Peregrinibacteria bacterium]|nr:type Z 30S ribosomal protein S14 [Candidatus Peregrinibacteria bacterium]